MKKSRVFMSTAMFAGSCVFAATLAGFAPADSAETNAVDAVAAVQRVAPSAISNVATADGGADAAVEATSPQGAVLRVPFDPSEGVTVGTAGDPAAVTIGLPFADQATNATESQKDGVVVYDNRNGTSTVPVARADGSVQITTVIDNASAPKRFGYPINVPAGGTLSVASDGSASITNDGETILRVAPPWAKDASGASVPTHYEAEGTTLVQVVEIGAQTQFPVVADPSYTFYTIIYSRTDVEQMWAMANHINNACHYVPLPYLGSLSCQAPPALKAALDQAHYQNKRVKAIYYSCNAGAYCSYYTYSVVS